MEIISIIKQIFGVASSTKTVIENVEDRKKKRRGMVNKILAETEFNMKLILDHYLKKNVDALIIIEKLKDAHLSKALDDGFDFDTIKKGKVKATMVKDVKFLKHYVGMDCEELLKKIRAHIEQVKLLPELYDIHKTEKVNVQMRLLNLGKRYILFSKFLKAR